MMFFYQIENKIDIDYMYVWLQKNVMVHKWTAVKVLFLLDRHSRELYDLS